MNQKPSIGRIVHYTTEVLKNPNRKSDEMIIKTYPAVILELAGEVPVYDENGKVKTAQQAAAYLQVFGCPMQSYDYAAIPFSEKPKVGHWSWPPKV